MLQATPPLILRHATGELVSAEDLGARIENFEPEPDGGVRSARGPAPFLSTFPSSGASVADLFSTPVQGVCVAALKGGSQIVTLVQTGGTIKRFRGWSRDWQTIITAADIPTDAKARAPAQFIVAPNGIIILPQGGQPWFYDGDLAAPLGFSRAPGTPLALGPTSTNNTAQQDDASRFPGINDQGYAHDGSGYTTTAMHPDFGVGRIGTVVPVFGVPMQGKSGSNTNDVLTARVSDSVYQYAVQFIDPWGNLSPLSPRSNPVRISQQDARWYWAGTTNGPQWRPGRGEQVQKQLALSGIDIGPEHTVGRILYRTRDLLNSGTDALYEIPLNLVGGAFAFSTLPDRESRFFPDNVSDTALVTEAQQVRAVSAFSVGAIWDGRLWAGGFRDDPGAVDYSLPGLWGTFGVNTRFRVTTGGKGITGIFAAQAGLLAFTENTATLVVRNTNGDIPPYRRVTLSSRVGCAAPASIQTLADGSVIWLARDGFYTFNGESVVKVSQPLDYLWRRVNADRLIAACSVFDERTQQYRCWISVDGNPENALCLVFDGRGWQTRTGEPATAACLTPTRTPVTLYAGEDQTRPGFYGLWVMDRQVQTYTPAARQSVIQTAWINALESFNRTSTVYAEVWFRETTNARGSVSVLANYRNVVEQVATGAQTPPSENAPVLYPVDNPPAFWGTATWVGGTATRTSARWARRRPFWRRVSFALHSVEAFQIILSGTNIAFLGVRFITDQKDPADGRMPP